MGKIISKSGNYEIQETNARGDYFSIPFLAIGDFDIKCDKNDFFLCYSRYIDYIKNNNLVAVLGGDSLINYYLSESGTKNNYKFVFDGTKRNMDEVVSDYYNNYEINFVGGISSIEHYNTNISTFTTPTGQIGMSDVRTELGMSGQIDLNNENVRALAWKRPSGSTISLNDLRGKTNSMSIRFTCSAGAVKNNQGTRRALFRNSAGTGLLDISGGGGHVCPTFGTKTHSCSPILKLKDVANVHMERYIDTSSDGWATMKIEFIIHGTATQVLLVDRSYRTGNGWQSNSYNMTFPG